MIYIASERVQLGHLARLDAPGLALSTLLHGIAPAQPRPSPSPSPSTVKRAEEAAMSEPRSGHHLRRQAVRQARQRPVRRLRAPRPDSAARTAPGPAEPVPDLRRAAGPRPADPHPQRQLGQHQPPGVRRGAARPALRRAPGGGEPGIGSVLPHPEPAGPYPAAAARARRVQPEGGGRVPTRIERTVGDLLDRAATRRASSTWSPRSPRRCRSPSSPTCSASRTRTRPASPATARSWAARWTASSRCGTLQQLIASSNATQEIFRNLFELRRREPGDDIVSSLVAASPDRISARRDAEHVRAPAVGGVRDHGQPDQQRGAGPARAPAAVARPVRRPRRPWRPLRSRRCCAGIRRCSAPTGSRGKTSSSRARPSAGARR